MREELGSVSSRVEGSTNTLSHGPHQEITLFPPPGVSHLSLSSTQINFEPLPDIRPRASTHPRDQHHNHHPSTHTPLPASFPSSPLANLPTDQWFAEPHQNFPRGQLQYVKELGSGWFGKVLEGRASGIFSDHTKGESPPVTSTSVSPSTRVAVRALREDASQAEQAYFLHELRPYRDLTHTNVLKVLAYCLETEPFLILLQLCPKGDLKGVVRSDQSLSESALLRMVLDAASGLEHMHSNNFIHTDLAARNCLVDEDHTVKIGDYGYNINSYKIQEAFTVIITTVLTSATTTTTTTTTSLLYLRLPPVLLPPSSPLPGLPQNEYYVAGDVALPLRWCAPETLRCTDTTIETKEVTRAANVWSFGVLAWEVVCRGQMPYPGLDDDRVIQKVVMDKSCVPDQPTAFNLHQDKLYNIMRQCWAGEDTRPPMIHILSLLTHLWQHSPHHTASHTSTSPAPHTNATMDDFEVRWKQLQQQQHCRDHSILHLGNTTDLRFESDFSLSAPGHLGTTVSPSLQNLHGSAEDLDARMAAKFGSALPSWLGMEPGQPIDSLTQEITDAILKLDDYLAGEKSEPSTTQTSPENGGINFKVGKDSFVSNPPDSKVPRIAGLSVEEASGHPSLPRSLSEGEDEGFTMRLEQGEFTEMVRLKSQSVQDFMKLTVVDDGSDSDNTSQRNSLAFEPLTQEKTFISEGNIKEALRDVKFMGELERLQAEHRYSIITEASKEYTSSIEYRMQDVSSELAMSQPEAGAESLAGSTDKLAASNESVTSSTRGHSEQEPFLGEVISSDQTGESRPSNNTPRDVNTEPQSSKCTSSSSTEQKPLPASPDCVVSSREPKPIALPDIVVHNSNVKLSMPSPSPEDSPAKIVNIEQPKEFRFVFEGESDDCKKVSELTGQEASLQCDSVIFSENIKNIETSYVAESEDGGMERKNYQEVNGKMSSPISREPLESVHEKETQSNGDVHKFRSLFQGESQNILTSTPYKKDNTLNIAKHGIGEDDDSSPVICNNLIVSKVGLRDENIDNSETMQMGEENLRTKHRYVFGSSEKKDEDEETVDDAYIRETSECIDVPDYKPEKIVEGEDIVIGALEDYSLDLYRAVKSSDVLPPCLGEESSSEHTHTDEENAGASSIGMSKMCLEREIRRTESEVSGIEFDLEQWDTFLDNTMSADKFGPDSVFQEGLIKTNNDETNEFEGDVLTSTKKSNETCVPFDKKPEMNVSDIDSTFERSACDEICNIMAGDSKIWSNTSEIRPEVNTTMFFSSDSTFDNKKNMSGNIGELLEDEAKEASSKTDSPEHTPVNERHSADDSFYTAQSLSSELFKTAVADSDLKLQPDTPTASADYSDNTLGSETLGSLNSSCTGQDTPSNSFTYKREGTVDSTFDSLEHVEYGGVGVLSNSNENFEGVAIENTDIQKPTQSLVSNALDKDNLDVTEKLTKNYSDSSVDIISCSKVSRDLFADAALSDSVSKDLPKFESDSLSVNDVNESKVSGNLILDLPYSKTDSGVGEDVGECDSDERPLASPSHQSPNYRSPTPTSPVYTSPYIVSSNKKSPTHATSPKIDNSLRSKEENSKEMTEEENRKSVNETVEEEVENGEFWKQQMVAWQEAAFQTRQLLQEAADGGGKEGEQAQEEVLEASPLSEASSRSHCSSTDLLNLDDEGSYISYNTTDDEEVLGYKPEDINALRAELSLKLGGLSEEQHQEQQQQDLEPEEPDDQVAGDRENVVINYRGILATTLSPIKEESFLEDEDTPTRKLSVKSSSDIDSVHDPSIEFEEPEDDTTDGQDLDSTFVVTNLVSEHIIDTDLLRLSDEVSLGERVKDTSDRIDNLGETQSTKKAIPDEERISENVKIENPHDSLILEDLDDEDGPSSIQIINARTNIDTEDILLVDTETNQATIVDQGKPRSHLAFITDQEEEVERTEVQPFMFDETDDVAPESIPSVGGSRFDEMRYREQFLTNNPSWDKPCNIEQQEFEADLESKPATDFLISSLPSGSPECTPQHEVPHYHSYFTSALNTITHPNVTTFSSLTHPNASIEEPQEPQHISLPYDVNYPAAGEQLHSLEDINGGAVETCIGEETKISEIEDDDEEDIAPIKLNLIGRFYSDESEDKDEKDNQSNDERNNKEESEKDNQSVSEDNSDQQAKKMDKMKYETRPRKSSDSHEASLLSDSEDEGDTKVFDPENASQMTSAQFLASKTYQTNDDDEIEEEIEVEGGYDEDSEEEEEEEERGSSPRKAAKDGSGAEGEEVGSGDPRYTPDWESDTDSDGESSSTSGEFMWRPGEPCQPTTYVLDVIEEEPEQREGRQKEIEEEEEEDEEGGSGEESESGEEEFTPSQWNSDLTPSHSLLKSPLNKSSLKKRVRWKRQRHHRVYEYPPEPRSWEPGSSFSQSDRRAWQRSSLDYLTLADWELGSDEFIADDGGDMEDYVYHKPTRPAPPPPIYSLGSMTYDDTGDGFLVDNGEFFIRSSGSPFTFNRSTFSASDFFPGGHTVDYDVLFGTQTQGGRQAEFSGMHNNTEQLKLEGEAAADVGDKQAWGESSEKRYEHEREGEENTIKDDKTEKEFAPTLSMNETDNNFPTLEELDQASSTASASLGQLRHTRDRLRLEIPSISVGGDDMADLENGRPVFPSVSFKRTEPEVSEV
ncbi:hypothetical protein Pcinc_033799 [Petrolisthes cinctipes]|uniref:Protein kinase domain-containing protein n=1 Tax=Petrolisthes cinctipes TaxID=88211 RepID=A0AAE1ERF7_PETCI|nr:hypothetical protein Pcinc_033799 [Petrolisthes cinctipes]